MKLLCSVVLCLVSFAAAQLPVGINVPEDSVITVDVEKVSFDLEAVGFPPPEFPAYYPATEIIEMRLYSNTAGKWIVHMGMQDGFVHTEGYVIPIAQLEYRLNEGQWYPMAATINLLEDNLAHTDYQTHKLELRLKLVGNERPGLYQAYLDFSLTKL